MTKREVKNLEERVHFLDQKTQDSTAHLEADARMSWLILHLTEDETIGLSKLIVKLEHDNLDKSAQEEAQQLQRKAEERTGAESSSAWETYREKHVRVETLRHSGRRLTGAESEELNSLNTWLWETRECIKKRMQESENSKVKQPNE